MIYRCVKTDAHECLDIPSASLLDAETGKAVRQPTTVQLYQDDANLHVRFECIDSDIRGTFTAHDDPIYLEEVVEVFMCPDGDLSRYFEINVSPRNVVFDAIIHYNKVDGSITADKSWDCEGLETAVKIEEDRWTVEMSIPFAGLGRPTPKPREEWKINLYRIDRSNEGDEFQAWSPTLVTPANFHVPERFGRLVF